MLYKLFYHSSNTSLDVIHTQPFAITPNSRSLMPFRYVKGFRVSTLHISYRTKEKQRKKLTIFSFAARFMLLCHIVHLLYLAVLLLMIFLVVAVVVSGSWWRWTLYIKVERSRDWARMKHTKQRIVSSEPYIWCICNFALHGILIIIAIILIIRLLVIWQWCLSSRLLGLGNNINNVS